MSNSMSSDKEVRKIIKTAKQAGWRVEKSGGNHILLYPPDKSDGMVTMPSTPSSTRNFKNMLSKLRSKGLNV